jgi:hypothetical protein
VVVLIAGWLVRRWGRGFTSLELVGSVRHEGMLDIGCGEAYITAE